MQAKDIDNTEFARSIMRNGMRPTGWTGVDTIAEDLGVPRKVVIAKLRAFIKQGFAEGCPCGCRGDAEMTPKGMELFG